MMTILKVQILVSVFFLVLIAELQYGYVEMTTHGSVVHFGAFALTDFSRGDSLVTYVTSMWEILFFGVLVAGMKKLVTKLRLTSKGRKMRV